MKIRKNGKVINLTESDLKRIVKKVLVETEEITTDCPKRYEGGNISDQIETIEKGTKEEIKGLSWSDIKSTNGYFRCKGVKNAITKISNRFKDCDLQEILDEIADKMDKTNDKVEGGRYNYMFAQKYGITDAGTEKLCQEKK